MADESDSGLPSKEDIAELPRWAIVAFAARCVRRVQPLIRSSAVVVNRIAAAIDVTERAAAHARAHRSAPLAAADGGVEDYEATPADYMARAIARDAFALASAIDAASAANPVGYAAGVVEGTQEAASYDTIHTDADFERYVMRQINQD